MNWANLSENLKNLGFVQVSAFEHSGSAIFGYYDESKIERLRVAISNQNQYAQVSYKNQDFVFGEEEQLFKKIKEILPQIESNPVEEKDLAAARLVREVRTLRLSPDDYLVVTVKDPNIEEAELETLMEALSSWLGEKKAARTIVLKGDIELTKVKK